MPRKPKTPRWLEAARVRSGSEKADWLSRALSRAGAGRLPDVERAITEGRVKVAGRVVKEPLFSLSAGAVVQLDGREVDLAPRTRVLMFHKPRGVVTAGTDPEGVGTVFDALQAALPEALQNFGWHAVGRLDRDTTGLLLFTNDERFVEHATSPSTHLEKRYVAEVGANVTQKALEALTQGLVLNDGPTLPARAERRGPRTVALTLTEGRHHQVKRMLGKVGLPVLALHREAVGALELDLAVGAVRALGDAEVRDQLRYVPR
jgi:23S rRNA pseudouridine2605 synthase